MNRPKTEYKRLKKLARQCPVLYTRLAGAELELGKAKDARITLTEGLLNDADNPTAHLLLAQANTLLGHYEAALHEYEETLRLDSLNIRARKAYADLLHALGRSDQEFAAHTRLYELTPSDPVINQHQKDLILTAMRDVFGEDYQWNDDWTPGDFTEIGGLSIAVSHELELLPARTSVPAQFIPDVDETLVSQITARLPQTDDFAPGSGSRPSETDQSARNSGADTTAPDSAVMNPIPLESDLSSGAAGVESVFSDPGDPAETEIPNLLSPRVEDAPLTAPAEGTEPVMEIVNETPPALDDVEIPEVEEAAADPVMKPSPESVVPEVEQPVLEEPQDPSASATNPPVTPRTQLEVALQRGGQSFENVVDFEAVLNDLSAEPHPLVEPPDFSGPETAEDSEGMGQNTFTIGSVTPSQTLTAEAETPLSSEPQSAELPPIEPPPSESAPAVESEPASIMLESPVTRQTEMPPAPAPSLAPQSETAGVFTPQIATPRHTNGEDKSLGPIVPAPAEPAYQPAREDQEELDELIAQFVEKRRGKPVKPQKIEIGHRENPAPETARPEPQPAPPPETVSPQHADETTTSAEPPAPGVSDAAMDHPAEPASDTGLPVTDAGPLPPNPEMESEPVELPPSRSARIEPDKPAYPGWLNPSLHLAGAPESPVVPAPETAPVPDGLPMESAETVVSPIPQLEPETVADSSIPQPEPEVPAESPAPQPEPEIEAEPPAPQPEPRPIPAFTRRPMPPLVTPPVGGRDETSPGEYRGVISKTLIKLQIGQGKYDHARAMLNRMRSLHPDDPDLAALAEQIESIRR